MLKVTINPDKYAIDVHYDGTNFCILHAANDVFIVTVERWYGYDWFGDKPYGSLAEACEAIFNDICLDRFESGKFIWKDDEIVASVPLTYYERPAFRPAFDGSYDAEDLMFCR